MEQQTYFEEEMRKILSERFDPVEIERILKEYREAKEEYKQLKAKVGQEQAEIIMEKKTLDKIKNSKTTCN